MKSVELKNKLREGALKSYTNLYTDIARQTERMIAAVESFERRYGSDREVMLLSVPGRSEIIGNHTDHNRGKVMAGAIDRDIIAVAAKNTTGTIRLYSEGYPEDTVNLSEVSDPTKFRHYTSHALVGGMAEGFKRDGYEIGGFDAYTTTEVLKGSGLSSSAAFEVMIGNIFNHLYNGGSVDNKEIAKLAQFAENVYFGKPCGLMDQMACAVGGFVYIDFADEKNPTVEPIAFSLSDEGYALCIVNTGGSHANLNEDYASVPSEMRAVAAALGREVLRGLTEADIIEKIPALREKVGDRAILRALHFVRENGRVEEARCALKSGALSDFLNIILRSGRSSFEYLQNVYTSKLPTEQGLSLSIAVTDGYLSDKGGAFRVHGGGFAGTTQAFIKREHLDGYVSLMDGVFGKGAAMPLSIRPLGATRLF
ncbi:MAG: galactokinase [Clostridia bacterium]|nr:galactokinase [Clostridia bacterium]MBQ8583982.1 galactokinase [Clostridia bacterium]